MLHLKAEAERARRLAATVHDTKLARELTTYAIEVERVIARNGLDDARRVEMQVKL